VTRRGDQIILNMPEDITFTSGSSRLKSGFDRTLNSVALVLRKYDRTTVLVNGHTDSDGSSSSNMDLSNRRALTVSNFLASRGVNSGRLVARGFGESQPIASNNSSAGKARNRRVEIHIAPR
jgi:outer membrane protein OmpA-like peptidoglycan-associated protein